MNRIYYLAAYTDGGCVVPCTHRHSTVHAAAACIATAGGYVVAVQNQRMRELNRREEEQYEKAMYGADLARGEISGDSLLGLDWKKVAS